MTVDEACEARVRHGCVGVEERTFAFTPLGELSDVDSIHRAVHRGQLDPRDLMGELRSASIGVLSIAERSALGLLTDSEELALLRTALGPRDVAALIVDYNTWGQHRVRAPGSPEHGEIRDELILPGAAEWPDGWALPAYVNHEAQFPQVAHCRGLYPDPGGVFAIINVHEGTVGDAMLELARRGRLWCSSGSANVPGDADGQVRSRLRLTEVSFVTPPSVPGQPNCRVIATYDGWVADAPVAARPTRRARGDDAVVDAAVREIRERAADPTVTLDDELRILRDEFDIDVMGAVRDRRYAADRASRDRAEAKFWACWRAPELRRAIERLSFASHEWSRAVRGSYDRCRELRGEVDRLDGELRAAVGHDMALLAEVYAEVVGESPRGVRRLVETVLPPPPPRRRSGGGRVM